MTENSATSGAPPTGAPAAGPYPGAAFPPPLPPPRPDVLSDLYGLRRSRTDRVIAGVCGGVARRLGVDPVLVRVVVAAMTLFAGAGVLLYALGWLLLPEEDTGASVLDRALGRDGSGSRTRALLLGGALVLVAIVTTGIVFGGIWDGPVLFVLAVIAIVLLLRRSPRSGVPAGPPTGWPAAPVTTGGPATGWPASQATGWPATPAAAAEPATDWPASPAGPATGWPTGPAAAAPATSIAEASTGSLPIDDPTRPVPLPGDTAQLPAGQPTPAWYAAPPTPPSPPSPPSPPFPPVWQDPPPPPRPKERSRLFGIVASVVLVALGILVLADVQGADIAAAAYVAVPLAIVGLGLLLGAWIGRSRGLVVVGILLGLALPLATAIDEVGPFDGEQGDVTVIASAVDEGTGSYDYGAGEIRYDLSDLDFTDLDETLAIDLGVGAVRVVLPPDVDVDVNAEVGVGSVRVLDFGERSGFGREFHDRDLGQDGLGGGRLQLTVDVGIGDVEVTRATA